MDKIQSKESKDEAEKIQHVQLLRNRVHVPPKSLAKVLCTTDSVYSNCN